MSLLPSSFILITFINLCLSFYLENECPFKVLVSPCLCQPLTNDDKNDAFYALKCSEISSDQLLQVFKAINGSKLSDRFTEFIGNKIDFTSSNGHLNPSFFLPLPRLNKVSLTKSNLKSLDKTSFYSYNFYDEIDLSENQLELIPRDFFLTGSMFNLSNNRIIVIPSRCFHNFKKIDLSNNLISKIESGAFTLNSYYESLMDLKWNRLSDSSFQDQFINLLSPLVLDVSYNKMTYFDANLFKGIKRLTAEDNPLSCDCRFKWIVDEAYFPFKGHCKENGFSFLTLAASNKLDFSNCGKYRNTSPRSSNYPVNHFANYALMITPFSFCSENPGHRKWLL